MSREWFKVQNVATDPTVAEIHIIDFIGGWDDDWIARNFGYEMGVTAKAFVEALAQLPDAVKAIHLHINSPGGDVQGGINIANALREQQASKGRTVETFIDGIAASIASVIAMAGSKVHIGDNALMMVHNPWSWAIGNAGEMRKVADILDAMRGQIVATYRWHSDKPAEDLIALMDAETWLDADAAIEAGLATDKVEGLQAAASIDARAALALKVPEQYKARVQSFLKAEAEPAPKPEPMAALDVVRACKAADCSDLAEELIASGATAEQVTAKVESTKAARAEARARATEITAICAASKRPEMAATMIASGLDVAGVKAHLANVRAAVDEARGHLDTSIDPDHGNPASIRASWKAAFARTSKRSGVATATKH